MLPILFKDFVAASLAALLPFCVVALGQTASTTKKTSSSTSATKAGTAKTGTAKKTSAAKKTAPAVPEVELPAEKGLYAVFNTSMGVIITKLFEDKAPITVKNFVALATATKPSAMPKTHTVIRHRFYNGLTFHRVIKGFMIQFGDIDGTGMGDCKSPTIPDEYDPSLKFDAPGKLAMANIGQPHTGACQAFITVGAPEHLNGRHTIFGEVVKGQEIAVAISEVPTGAADKPVTPVVIKSLLIRRKE